jgi:hypothetical protein
LREPSVEKECLDHFGTKVSWQESLPPEQEDNPFDGAYNPQGFLLSDASSEPVIEAEILVDQVASHFLSPEP